MRWLLKRQRINADELSAVVLQGQGFKLWCSASSTGRYRGIVSSAFVDNVSSLLVDDANNECLFSQKSIRRFVLATELKVEIV